MSRRPLSRPAGAVLLDGGDQRLEKHDERAGLISCASIGQARQLDCDSDWSTEVSMTIGVSAIAGLGADRSAPCRPPFMPGIW